MLKIYVVYEDGDSEEVKDLYTLAYKINRKKIVQIMHKWLDVTNGNLLEEKIFELVS